MKCIDHLVSKEEFELKPYKNYDILQTHPIPMSLDVYYDSQSYISHTNSKKSLIDSIYQIVKKRAIRNKYRIVKKHSQGNRILDIGAGTGDFINYFSNKGWETYGVEPNQNAIKNAKKNRITLHTQYPEGQKYDVITLWHVLEHLDNIEQQIASLKKYLNPYGKIIIAVPNHQSWDAKHYKETWAAYDVPRHLWHFSIQGMSDFITNNGLSLNKIYPMWYDAFYVSILSEKYNKVGFPLCFIKGVLKGLVSNLKASQTNQYSSNIFIASFDN